jgi:hypothetical protein
MARLRGPLALLAAVALVLGVPGLAYATFTSRTTATVTAGTYKVPTPAFINGTLHCASRGATITFTDFGKVARATGYTATLTGPKGAQRTVSVVAGSSVQMSLNSGAGQYTFTLAARLGSWTGAPLEQFMTC